MKLGKFNKSIQDMLEETDLTIKDAKQCKLRITQAVYNGDLEYVGTDEKKIVGIEVNPDEKEIILSVVDKK